MDAERWARIKSIFHAAAERPADDRAAFIRSECEGDETLASEVESLLAANDQAGSFIEAFPNQEATVNLEDLPIERMTGQQIGPYKVIKMIGRGGMGEVYLVQDSRLGRKVALKFLPASLSADDRARKRLVKEAQAAAKLDHPNICTIYEVGQQDGLDFIAMQYVEGESLASIQKFNAPVEQATTSSLEALQAFTRGNEIYWAGKYFEAIPFFKRAVELDSNFALAYLKLGIVHTYISKYQLAAEYAERAFELRGRASEREKLYISNFYYAFTTGEIEKGIEVAELWTART